MSDFLPYGRQLIEDDDVEAVIDALRSDYLTTGPRVDAFERALAETVDAPYAVSCSSATAGLHLATLAVGLGPGDVAIVPTVTFLATANAVRLTGADVLFADVDPATGLMRVEDLAAALERAPDRKAVKAVLPVHLTGQRCDGGAINRLARAEGLKIIEDAAHSVGGAFTDDEGRERWIGDCLDADACVFSFHPVKTIAMGEGGAVTTRDPELATQLQMIRSHGMTRDAARFENPEQAFEQDGAAAPWYYEMHRLGLNYRVTDLQCALGLSQLAKLDRFVERRRSLCARYDALTPALAPLAVPIERTPGCRPAWHLYVLLIDFERAGVERGALMRAMAAEGLGTQVHYIPVHRQPYYRRLYGPQTLPGADAYYARCLSLPLHPGMRDDDPARVVAALERLLGAEAARTTGGASR